MYTGYSTITLPDFLYVVFHHSFVKLSNKIITNSWKCMSSDMKLGKLMNSSNSHIIYHIAISYHIYILHWLKLAGGA